MNQLQSFAKECVSHYAKFDRMEGGYHLDVRDLPDFVQHELAGILMSEDNGWASEATGPDNQHWETKMLPALTRYLKNSTNKDEAIEFNTVWRDCVTDYMNNRIQEILDNAVSHEYGHF